MPSINKENQTITFEAFELNIRKTVEGDEVLQIQNAFNQNFIAKAREIGVELVEKQDNFEQQEQN